MSKKTAQENQQKKQQAQQAQQQNQQTVQSGLTGMQRAAANNYTGSIAPLTYEQFQQARQNGVSIDDLNIFRGIDGSHDLTYDEFRVARQLGVSTDALSQYRDQVNAGKKAEQQAMAPRGAGQGAVVGASPVWQRPASRAGQGLIAGAQGGDLLHAARQGAAEEASKAHGSALLDYLGSVARLAQDAQGGIMRSPAEQQAQNQRIIDAADQVRQTRDALNRERQPIEWQGRQELIDEYKRLRATLTYTDPEYMTPQEYDQQVKTYSRIQEIERQLTEGDRRAGNGDRVYSFGHGAENVGKALAGGYFEGFVDYGALKLNQALSGVNTNEYAGWATDPMSAEQIGFEHDQSKMGDYAAIQNAANALQQAGGALRASGQEALGRVMEGKSKAAQFGWNLAINMGQMMLDRIVGAVTGVDPLVPMYIRSAGSSARDAMEEGYGVDQQAVYGTVKGLIEVLTEKAGGLGSGVFYGKGWTDALADELVTRLAKNPAAMMGLRVLFAGFEEGAEEGASYGLDPLARWLAGMKQPGLNMADAMEDMLSGFAMGVLGAGGQALTGGYNAENYQTMLEQASRQATQDWYQSGGWLADRETRQEAGREAVYGQDYVERMQQLQAAMQPEQEYYGEETAPQSAAQTAPLVQGSQEQAGQTVQQGAQQAEPAQTQTVAQEEEAKKRARTETMTGILQRETTRQGMKNPGTQVLGEMAKVYEPGTSGQAYARAALEAYQLGQQGHSFEEARQLSESAATLSAEQFRTAWGLGSGVKASEMGSLTQRDTTWEEAQQSVTVNGESARILGVETGKVLIQQNGETRAVAMDSVEGLPESYRRLVAAATHIQGGDAMLRAYQPGQNVNAYVKAWNRAYSLYGAQTDMTVEKARKAGKNSLKALTDEQLRQALSQGRETAPEKGTATRSELTGQVQYWQGGELDGVEYDAVTEDEARELLGDGEMRLLTDVLSSVVNVTLYKSKADASGKFSGAQGMFFRDGRIYLDVNAGLTDAKTGQRTIVLTAAHELTHFIRAYNETGYKALRSFITNELTEQGLSIDSLVNQKIARASSKLSLDDAMEEVIADACETMLTDEARLRAFAEAEPKAAKTIGDWLRDFAAKLRARLKGLKAVHTEAIAMQERIDELSELWYKALSQARETASASEAIERLSEGGQEIVEGLGRDAEALTEIDPTEEAATATLPDGTKYSIRSMRHDIAENKMFEDLERYTDMSRAEIRELRTNLTRLTDIIALNRDILDLNESFGKDNRPFKPYKPNSDPLYTISLDFSTLCRKRLMTQFVIERLQTEMTDSETGKRGRPLSAEEQLAVRDLMKEYAKQEKALKVACAMCYVEAARLKAPKQIQRFMRDPTEPMRRYFALRNSEFNASVRQAQADFKEQHGYARDARKADMKPSDVKALNKLSDRLRSEYQLSAEEQRELEIAKTLPNETYLTAANLAKLAEEHPIIYDAYTATIRSATRSKSLEADIPYYYGDSSRAVTDDFIAAVNQENGMRFSSWSDFQIQHMLDMMTAVIELSTRHCAMHGYTKFLEQVRIFGRTGMMFNMSGVANGTGLKEDGSLDFSPTESVLVFGQDGEYDAIRARDEFPETAGLQCIGISHEHIQALLDSDIIDYIIPYHTSGLNATLRRMAQISNWDDFTTFQNAKVDSSIKFDSSIHNRETWHKEPVFSEFFNAAKQESNGYRAGEKGIVTMRRAADLYKQMCRERGMMPKFSWSNSKVDADFSNDPNYWKLLIDRKMINQKTGALIEQKPVRPDFDFKLIEQMVQAEVDAYDPTLQDRALEYVRNHMDELPQRIADLKKAGAVKKITGRKTSKAAKTLQAGPVAAVSEANAGGTETENGEGAKHADRDAAESAAPVRQEYSSAATSINANKLPVLYTNKHAVFTPGGVNIDVGGGRFDNVTEYLAGKGVTSMIFDPYNRSDEFNRRALDYLISGQQADTATCSNCLNVIREAPARANVILECAKAIKPDGKAYFTVYEGDGSGVGKVTKSGWQENRKTADYVQEIKQYFDIVVRRGNLITAERPRPNLPKAAWETSPGNATMFSDRDAAASDGEVYNRRALVSEETLDKWMSSSYFGSSNPNYAQAYITYMSPADYLRLTTIYEGARIRREAQGLKPGAALEYSREQPIQLRIDAESGKIDGHEGRHRMAAFEAAGVREVPVLLFDSRTKYSKTPLETLDLQGQDFNGMTNSARTTVQNVLPLNRANRDAVVEQFSRKTGLEAMQEKYNGHQTAMFSQRDTEAVRRQQAKDRAKLEQLRREKNAKIEEVRRQGIQDKREAVAKEKTEKWRRVQETKDYYRDMQKRDQAKRTESAGVKKYRKQVAEKTAKLYELLMTNSDAKHVPQALKKPLAEFLESVDFSSKRLLEAEAGALAAQSIQRAGVDPRVVAEGGMASISQDAYTQADLKFGARIQALEQLLTNQQRALEGENVEPTDLGGYLDISEENLEYLREISQAVTQALSAGQTYTINQMSAQDLQNLSKLLSNIGKAIRGMNKFLANARFQSVQEAASRDIETMGQLGRARETDHGGVSRFLTWENGIPYYIFKRFGEGGRAIFDGFTRGWEKMAMNAKEIIDFSERTYKSEEVREWEKTIHDIELEDGSKIRMTTAQIMELSMLLGREQAMKHIEAGGIRIGDIETKKGKISDTAHYHLTANDIDTLLKTLTDRQREVAKAMQAYMALRGAEWGNEVSMARFGYQFYEEGPGYYPIKTDSNDRPMADTDAQMNSMFRLLNLSASKTLNPKASNALVVGSIFDTFSEHMADMAKLNGMGLPILDAIKWFNYKERIDRDDGTYDTRTLQGAMEQAYGSQAQKYFRTLMRDINGQTESGDRGMDAFGKAMSRYKIAAVGANLRVFLLQPTSYVRAQTVIKPKYLLAAFTSKNAYKEALEYSGTAVWKSLGYYDTDISKSMRSQIKHDETALDELTEKSMAPAEFGDQRTWGRLWVACKMQVKAERKLEGEALKKATADLFRDAIYSSQVMDGTLTRSEIMRSKGSQTKAASAFMAEPTLSYNILLDAASEFDLEARRSGKKTAWQKTRGKIGKAIITYVSSAAFSAIVESFVDAVRDEDDDKFLDKFLEAFLGDDKKLSYSGNLLSDLTLIGKLPFYKEFVSMIQGFQSGNMGFEGFSNALNAYRIWKETYQLATGELEKPTKLTNYGKMTPWGKVYKTLQALSQLSGIPAANLTRDVVAIWNSTAGAIDPAWKIRRYDNEKARNAENLMRALDSGNRAEIEAAKSVYADENDAISAAKSGVKEDFLNGAMTEEEAAKMLTLAGMDKNDAFFTVSGWATGDSSRYAASKRAAFAGDAAAYRDAMKDMTSHGYTEKQVQSEVKKLVRKVYFGEELSEEELEITGGAKLSEADARKILHNYAGLSVDEANNLVAEWHESRAFEKAHGAEYEKYDLTQSQAKYYYDTVKGSVGMEAYANQVNKYGMDVVKAYYGADGWKQTGLSVEVYSDYRTKASACKGTDADNDGKTDSGSVKAQVLLVIDALPVSVSVKDAIYLKNGWAESGLKDAPWH